MTRARRPGLGCAGAELEATPCSPVVSKGNETRHVAERVVKHLAPSFCRARPAPRSAAMAYYGKVYGPGIYVHPDYNDVRRKGEKGEYYTATAAVPSGFGKQVLGPKATSPAASFQHSCAKDDYWKRVVPRGAANAYKGRETEAGYTTEINLKRRGLAKSFGISKSPRMGLPHRTGAGELGPGWYEQVGTVGSRSMDARLASAPRVNFAGGADRGFDSQQFYGRKYEEGKKGNGPDADYEVPSAFGRPMPHAHRPARTSFGNSMSPRFPGGELTHARGVGPSTLWRSQASVSPGRSRPRSALATSHARSAGDGEVVAVPPATTPAKGKKLRFATPEGVDPFADEGASPRTGLVAGAGAEPSAEGQGGSEAETPGSRPSLAKVDPGVTSSPLFRFGTVANRTMRRPGGGSMASPMSWGS
ncbi:unnamed protein product [Pedinophyceae sp. YPF-701]|nr:unnamed protein product [Pedinophyceae sp. YPF-701]